MLIQFPVTGVSGLALANAPDFTHALPFLQPLADNGGLASGLATTLAPAVAAALFITFALAVINCKLGDPSSALYLMVIVGATGLRGTVSVSSGQLLVFKITFFILVAIAAIWLITVGSLLFAVQAFSTDRSKSQTVANGSIYMSVLALVIVLNVAVISPALLLLQPFRLWRLRRAEKEAITPRQTFRGELECNCITKEWRSKPSLAVYPRTYNPTFATGACVLAIIFACTFSLIFPLIGPAVVVLLFLTLVGGYLFSVGT